MEGHFRRVRMVSGSHTGRGYWEMWKPERMVTWSAVTTPPSPGLRVRTESFGDIRSSQEAGSRKYMLGHWKPQSET